MTYQHFGTSSFLRSDGIVFQADALNPEYQEMLRWVAQGNTIKPAAPPPAPLPQAQIDALERAHMLPRVTREFMLLQFVSVATANNVDPNRNAGFVKLKALDDQIAALRAQL